MGLLTMDFLLVVTRRAAEAGIPVVEDGQMLLRGTQATRVIGAPAAVTLDGVRQVDLCGNRLSRLPSFEASPSLARLLASSNQLRSMPAAIASLVRF